MNNNKELLAKSYFDRSLISKGLPSFMIIEPTNFCNLKCIMCPYPFMTRNKTHMDLNLYKRIIDQVKGHVEFIWLHLYSESLINKNIYEMIDYAEDNTIKTGLSTNATLLNESKIYSLLKTKLDLLIIAIDGIKKETYESIRRGAKFEETKKNIENFMAHKDRLESKMKVVLQCIDMKQTEEEVDTFKKHWSKFNFDNILIKNFHNFAGQIKSINRLNNAESKEMENNKVCFEPWIGLTVQSNGDVVPCCNDYDGKYVIGNCKSQPMRELWNNQRMQDLRSMFINNASRIDTLCENCDTPCIQKSDLYISNPFEAYKYHSTHFLK